ncbi:MAG: ATP synthase F1 subunit gamma [Flammeovirgaceae bacterium]
MPSLKEVRARINSVISTQQITKAMKMVAAAKLRKAQERIIQMRPYSKKMADILANVSATLKEEQSNPFAEVRDIEKVLIVVITSDRGLCGAFNTNVIKATNALLNEKFAEQFKKGKVELMCIGNKGNDYFRRRNYPMVQGYKELFNNLTFDNVRKAAEYAMKGFLDKKYDHVEIVYNEFKNVATQIVKSEAFLPLQQKSLQTGKTSNTDYIFEPSKGEIIAELIPKTLRIIFYKALLESNASEQGARMTAMDKATENAEELLKQLKLTYNQTRQASITKEILEIVGGAEALANG